MLSEARFLIIKTRAIGLNPCFSGTCSRSVYPKNGHQYLPVLILVLVEHALGAGECAAPFSGSSLNPCFSGTYSQRLPKPTSTSTTMRVLILVLVEHTLRESPTLPRTFPSWVLILVLVEHTLRARYFWQKLPKRSLNPCFSGTYSQSSRSSPPHLTFTVLILVLVEHTLRGWPTLRKTYHSSS